MERSGRWANKQGYFWTQKAWGQYMQRRRLGLRSRKERSQDQPIDGQLQHWREKSWETPEEIAAEVQEVHNTLRAKRDRSEAASSSMFFRITTGP